MDKELTTKFIDNVINEKKEDLLSVKMDIDFHKNQKKQIGNEEKLRAALSKAKEKVAEKRNTEIIETLEDKVNQLNLINEKLNKLLSIEPQILQGTDVAFVWLVIYQSIA